MKIVVADDSRVMRQIVIRTMRQAGYSGMDIIEATDGADAFEKFRENAPDLILSDWNMPNMTGIELLRKLRAAGHDVPFGFVTSEGSAEMRSTALRKSTATTRPSSRSSRSPNPMRVGAA